MNSIKAENSLYGLQVTTKKFFGNYFRNTSPAIEMCSTYTDL